MQTEHTVIIAGAGPTGLMLAGELGLAGVDVAIIERRAGQEVEGPRSRGLHARTLEVLDQRGIAERFLAEGSIAQVAAFAGVSFDISGFPTRHPYGLALFQEPFERILAGWVEELAVPVYRACELAGFTQDAEGVSVMLAGGEVMRAQYLVGCDGGRSMVRKIAGIDFPGSGPTVSNLLAEAEMRTEPPWGMRRDALGLHALSKTDDGARVSVLVTEAQPGASGEPGLRDLSEALAAVYGSDFGVHSPTWISRFTDMTRQAAAYRKGRILLAGDAAHVHPPDGGQGLQLGVQDAVNLGWKLAQVINRTSPESLLDSYHAERHPVAARVLRNTMVSSLLRRPDERTAALRDAMAELLSMDEPRTRYAAMMSGLDIRYDLGGSHPLAGRRMPDLELATAQGPQRVFTLLHQGQGLLLDLGGRHGFDIGPWSARVRLVEASCPGAWTLPELGTVPAPAAVLVRPDGYVAWVGELHEDTLAAALTKWFGSGQQPADNEETQ